MIDHDRDGLAARFDEHRARLRAVAYRMLGSPSEADDAVQEAWLRLHRADAGEVGNLGGWLTTVVTRVCLDMLRSRASRREEPLVADDAESILDATAGGEDGLDAEHRALHDVLLAESIGPALLVVLETLAPAERLAFVLHDVFALPFDEVAAIVGRTPTAARQLASRARRRVQGAATSPDADVGRQRAVVDAFLAASRDGDFEALLALLDPDVVLRADGAAVRAGASPEVRGAQAVAGTFSGRARVARPALVNGAVGAVWMHGGRPRVVFGITVRGGRIVEITLVADPEHIGQLDVATVGE